MALVPRIYINPYGQQKYKDKSSKSIFKEQNYFSHIIRAIDANQLTKVYQNDSIIYGLEVTNTSLSNNQRTVDITLSPGRIIQDNTLIDIFESITMSVEVFSNYDILETNQTENYFKISGNQLHNFPEDKQFAVFYSTNDTSINHYNWVVKLAVLDNDNTKIYTHQNISTDDNTGMLITNNFEDSGENGTILLTSKYQFEEKLDNNLVEFVPLYTKTDNYLNVVSSCTPGFDSNIFRIIYGVLYINRDLENLKINSDNYELATDNAQINIHGHSYNIRNRIDYFRNYDGGEILIC